MDSKELIVKPKTEVAVHTGKRDLLSFYEVPDMLDQIIKKEKENFLNNINCEVVIMDSFNKLSHAEDFIVEIPSGLLKMLKSGKATFDKSSKNPGGFTPNIRIKGKAGINGQATIVPQKNPQAITQCMSNLAMMAMVQSVLEKLEALDQKVEDIKKGQKNDRIGSIIGHFKGFTDLYHTFETSEEMKNAANLAYQAMQGGLAQLHLQIEEERKTLDGAPVNAWQSFWKSIIHPLRNESQRYQKCYEDFVYDLQLYNRLILLSDIILHLKGNNKAIAENHEKMINYCSIYIDDSFKKKMDFLMAKETSGIEEILTYNKNFDLTPEGILAKDMYIECKQEDIKYLNFKDNES